MNSLFVFRRTVSLYQNLYKTSSSLSPREIYSRMKKLIDSKEYKKTLDFFDQQSHSCTDFEINLALKACISLNEYQRGMNIRKNFSQNSLNNPYIQTTLIQFYSLISNNMPTKVLDLFDEMNIEPNQAILAALFSACSRVANDRAMKIGRKLLNRIPKNFLNDDKLLTSAINILMRFGDVSSAENLFQTIKKKDIVAYGAMMKGYIQNNMCDKALDLFEEITLNLSDVSYTIIFNACAQLSTDRAIKVGRKLLDEMPKKFENDNYIQNSTIDMLMKFGDARSAENLFQMIQKKNIITYGTMMNGYNINNEPLKSLKLFEDMKRDDINADAIVLIILIGACARIGMLSKCQSIVAQIPLHFYENQRIRNFINSYGKAGSVKDAQKIFKSIDKPDVVTYTAMINSFGLNRMDSEAVDLYRKMPNNLQDEVSSVCVLNACSHSGLLNEAHSIFNEVSHKTKKIISAMQFKAHDRSHSRSKEIYADAERISSELIKHGHNYDSSWITRPLHENETIESVLCAHSERLAIVFNFIQETKPSFIQITKNLRVCGDCRNLSIIFL
ncbi:unnamed protein product [Rotaria magnacalcarata]|uniref:DYW domain-containing protein n=2 Tax=Rotaria magnacalcarata TaxID=392030 RepID=A0A816G450_9BILA|nr:unnamed protein product [Rotaria magnacalcarata]